MTDRNDKHRSNANMPPPASVGHQQGDRVVMRHRIALQLDDFRAAPEGFESRPVVDAPELRASQAPFFSVIIPNYNGMRYLPGLLEALKRQTFHDAELILVDDASSDASVSWAEATHPEVRVIVNRHNLGFARSCNLGAAAARGKILILLNSDAQPEPVWLAQLAEAVCRNPGASMFASKVLLFDRPGDLHTTGDLMGRNGLPINRGVWERDSGQYDAQKDVFGPSGCALTVRRELWNSLGGFDEDFWMYLEDVDFAYRAQLMGERALYVPEARVLHHLTATAGGTLSSFYVGRNTIWVIAKNMPLRLLLENWRVVLGAQMRIALDALRHIRGAEARARILGQATGLLTLGRVLRKRHAIQGRRRVCDSVLHKQLYG